MHRAHALGAQLATQAPLTMHAGKEVVRRMRERFGGIEDKDLIACAYGSADFRRDSMHSSASANRSSRDAEPGSRCQTLRV